MPEGYTGNQWKPLRERPCQVFLSHAHVDRQAVERLNAWLRDTAGVQVWYDAEKMQAGQPFPAALADGIGESQSMIVAISKAAIESKWVQIEQNNGLAQSGEFSRFAVIPVRLEACDLPKGMFALSAVDAFDGRMDGPEAAKLLRSVHAVADLTPPEAVTRRVIDFVSAQAGDPPAAATASGMPVAYLTCGWRDTPNEALLGKAARLAFGRAGFHLIGDAEDHAHTDETRIKNIMAGCSGQVIVLPKRAATLSSPEFKSLRNEMQFGRTLGLRQFVVVEQGLQVDEWPGAASMTVDLAAANGSEAGIEAEILDQAEDLRGQWGPPANPQFVFVATDYDDLVVKDHVVRHISQITGLPCLRGSDFGRQAPAQKIEAAIRNAALVIANIVSKPVVKGEVEPNWNTCIEAGIAMGARRPFYLLARREQPDAWKVDALPFMIRQTTVDTYPDDQHLIGLIHRFARPFRRRVITG